MIRTTLCLLAVSAALPAQLIAPMSPLATFHRTQGDALATDAPSLPIASLGVQPGMWLRLRALGDWDDGSSLDVVTDLVGVFAGSSTLGPDTLQQRLTAAVAGGTAYAATSGTAVGNLPMDIGEDFWISRTGFSDEVTIRVPNGAAHLFVCVPDAFYSDNSDPDFDFGIEVSLVSAPMYPGTGGEDLLLGSQINGGGLDLNPIKTAIAGDVVSAAVYSPLDVLFGTSIAVIAVDLTNTGTLPGVTFPDAWFGPNVVIPFVTLVPSGQVSTLYSLNIPAGHAGTSVWIQGGALWPDARNTLFVLSEAHEIRLL